MHGYSDRINHAFAFAAKYHGAVAPVGAGMDYLAHPGAETNAPGRPRNRST